jgi:hypothetical protein
MVLVVELPATSVVAPGGGVGGAGTIEESFAGGVPVG